MPGGFSPQPILANAKRLAVAATHNAAAAASSTAVAHPIPQQRFANIAIMPPVMPARAVRQFSHQAQISAPPPVVSSPSRSASGSGFSWLGAIHDLIVPSSASVSASAPPRSDAAPASAASPSSASAADAHDFTGNDEGPHAHFNGTRIHPTHLHENLYHGDEMSMEEIIKNGGLLPKGDDLDIANHLIGGKNTAFRGASIARANQNDVNSGPNYFAGENGTVVHLDGQQVPSYDANSLTQDKYKKADGSTGSHPYAEETEQVIHAQVTLNKIIGFFAKDQGVSTYHKNPDYVPLTKQ